MRREGWHGHGITDALARFAVESDKERPGAVEAFLQKKEEEGVDEANGWDVYFEWFERDYERDHPKPDPDEYENGEEDDEFIEAEKKWDDEMNEARMEAESEERDEQLKTFLPYAFPADVFTEFYKIKEREKK
jgi:hypothetical protein